MDQRENQQKNNFFYPFKSPPENAGGGDGAEVIYALRNNNKLPNLILDNLEQEGQNIRDAYQRRLPSDTSKDYYFIHRNTGSTQPVIVEYGFLDSTADDVEQLKNNYEEYAEAVVRALSQYIGITYKAPTGSNYYTVVSGDSLWSIAKKYNTTVSELKELNNLTSNTLSIGQILKLPTNEAEESSNTYTVKSGDTLYSIANKYNTTVSELKSLNNLTSNTLSIGQTLKIPSTENYINYTVVSGDNLYSIARKYNTTVDAIKNLNNLTSNLLSIGQTLKIPADNQNATDNNYIEYTVKSGDTLYSIARNYNITQSELMDYNNLTSNLLSIGQTLKIPLNNISSSNKYTVKSGDTLYSIARKYNTTADSIKSKNNLTSNTLSIGQVLTI
jgi:LysM repeat protein